MIDNERIPPEMLERIEEFTLLDDIFMSAVFDNNPDAAGALLRIILDRKDLTVTDVHAQKRLINLLYHGVTLDIDATTSTGDHMDVEVQRESKGAPPRRGRYILTMMDHAGLEKGLDYTELRDSYVIFITERDYFGLGKPLYKAEWKLIDAEETPFDVGTHMIYVNGAFKAKPGEETELSKLIHDFHCKKAEDMLIPELASTVWDFKNTERGQKAVSKVIQDLIENAEAAAVIGALTESVVNIVANLHLSVDQAMDALAIPADQRIEIKKRLEENK